MCAGGQINLQKGHASAAACQAYLMSDLHICLAKNYVDNIKLPFLFRLQEPPVYKGKIIGFGSSQKLISTLPHEVS